MPKSETFYIAGPISLDPDFHSKFMKGRDEVLAMGYLPVTPLEVCRDAGLVEGSHTWREFMNADIRALLECDGLYALRGWENSRGARLEHLIAEGLGMRIIYQKEE